MVQSRSQALHSVISQQKLSPKKVVLLSVGENVIGGTVCVTCHLCSSLFALSPLSLGTTSLSGKPLRSKIDLKVKHKRFPQGRRKINYDRWLFGLVLFCGVGVGSDKQAI